MEIGDSIFYEGAVLKKGKVAYYLKHLKDSGKRGVSRTVENGVRLWRIS